MHSRNSQFMLLTIVGSLLLGSGCRNMAPESQYSLRSRSWDDAEDFDEPPSRLHSNLLKSGKKNADHVASKKSSQKTSGTQLQLSDNVSDEQKAVINRALADLGPEEHEYVYKKLQQNSSSNKAPATSAAATMVTEKDERIPNLGHNSDSPAKIATQLNPTVDATVSQSAPSPSVTAQPAPPSSQVREELTVSNASEPASSVAQTSAVTDVVQEPVVTQVAATTAQLQPTIPRSEPATDIKNSTTETVASSAPSPDATSHKTTPLGLDDASEEQLLSELISRYENRLAQAPNATDQMFDDLIKMRMFLLCQSGLDAATQPVSGFSPSEQESLNYLMLTFWHLTEQTSQPVRDLRWAAALPDLRQAANHMAAATGNLQVQNLAFCTAVNDFGSIVTFEKNRFTAGQEVILYSEVENFVAERLSNGYETHLRGTYRILDSTGRRIAQQVLAEDLQTCNNYRRDYFIAYILYLPDRLQPGNYTFELTLEDVKGNHSGQARIPFEIITAGS